MLKSTTQPWESTLVSPKTSILEALDIIDNSSLQIALVVDEERRLLGTVTDGDVRRAILELVSLSEPVENIMFTDPTVASIHDSRDTILSKMRIMDLQHIPILDDEGHVVGLTILKDMFMRPVIENPVVLMAGGQGARLKPLTDRCPKPLLKVGGKPILETILENFVEHGFYRFFISLNYMGEMIEEYFGDGSRWGVKIEYIKEEKELGTAGALGILPERPSHPLVVMNGDLLTKINLRNLLDFHLDNRADATMCVVEYDFKVPFGVVQVDKYLLSAIEEKPLHTFFINAGIYVLNPEVLDLVEPNTYLDMTNLFDKLLSKGKRTAVFPIHEYWVDIGRMRDYEYAGVKSLKEPDSPGDE